MGFKPPASAPGTMAKSAPETQFALVSPDNVASVEPKEDGTLVVHHVVKEWQPTAPESLREIEETIDSWGRTAPPATAPREDLDLSVVQARVDKITRKVKSRRKEVVTETVTEWVEGPVGSGPIAVEDEPAPAVAETRQDQPDPRKTRPKRRFSLFRKAKADETADPRSKGGKDYQPQCAALTADGAQCRNSSRDGSRYCISHFGYQPPTTKGLAQRIEGDAWDPGDSLTDRDSVRSVDTRPAVSKARDTRLKVRKAPRKGRANGRKGARSGR